MTTTGYEAEPQYVAALLDNLLGDLLGEPDPMVRYHKLTMEQALYDALVSAIKARRGAALAELREQQGLTLAQVADLVGLGSKQRVAQLIEAAPADGEDQH